MTRRGTSDTDTAQSAVKPALVIHERRHTGEKSYGCPSAKNGLRCWGGEEPYSFSH
jgi:hypothetical protein